MNHQPFETWIFDDSEPSYEEQQSLQNHLASCPDCCQLFENWQHIHVALKQTTLAAPRQGFTKRWKENLAARRAFQQQQTRRLLLFLITGSLLVLLAFIIYLATNISFVNMIGSLLEGLAYLIVIVNRIQRISVILPTLPRVIPLGLWILISTSASMLSLLWVFSIWKISTKGVTQNENSF
ncbi:MAG: zf-HC2 domain-containing protein [Anaerolineales bacterium]|jgi:ABC-type multidrug transport system fused ATPase/permease subunit